MSPFSMGGFGFWLPTDMLGLTSGRSEWAKAPCMFKNFTIGTKIMFQRILDIFTIFWPLELG